MQEADSAPAGVLHAGAAAHRVATASTAAILVAAAWGVLQLWGIGAAPFHSRGEPREAVVVQDLVRRNEWILPQRNGEQLPRKPPLFYWLAGAAAHMRGRVDEAGVRLPSVVLSGVACVLVAAVVSAFYGGVAGVTAGFVLLSSFEWARAATSARVDMTLTFGLTLSFIGLLLFRSVERPAWLALFYAGAAWATLSKGIPGIAVPAFAVLLVCLLADRSLAFAWRLRPITGGIAVLLVAGAWYVAAAARGGHEFIAIVVNENLVRAVGSREIDMGHIHSVRYLIAALLLGLLPWTVFLPSVGLALWHDRMRIDRWDPRIVSLVWVVAVFTPYALATSKRSVYLLGLYPAVALLVGWWAGRAARGDLRAPVLGRVLTAVAWGLAALFGLAAVLAGAQAAGLPLLDAMAPLLPPGAAAFAAPIDAAARGGGLALTLAAASVAAALLACTAAAGRWRVALASMIACVAATIIGARLHVLPALAVFDSRAPFALALRRAVADSDTLSTGAALDYGTIFYLDRDLPVYDPATATDAPPYLMLPEPAWLRMPLATRRLYRRMPSLRIERGANQGYPVVLQRRDGGHPAMERRQRD
jgi:4-amino-4-deoxy-L-arabinose transferase-like glycosyltransferase